MLTLISYLLLQQYWWYIISILGGVLVFLLFVQGGQTHLYQIAQNNIERTLLINTLGKKWELTFTTLVTFGGALFAAFPLFYSTSFGGAYWLWIMILFCFVLQAISYEFRRKKGNLYGTVTFDTFLIINGTLGTFLLGLAVGTFFSGAPFYLNKTNITTITDENTLPIISMWKGNLYGLEAFSNPLCLMLGLVLLFLSRILATLYFINAINHEQIKNRSVFWLRINTLFFLLFFFLFNYFLFTSSGAGYNASTGIIHRVHYKYLNNLIEMPLLFIFFLTGIIFFLLGIILSLKKANPNSIWYSAFGAFGVGFSLFAITGLNNTCFYPSTYNLQSSLHIQNSSSSYYTLTVMSYVSLLLPLVITYIVLAWRSITKDPITEDKINNNEHIIY